MVNETEFSDTDTSPAGTFGGDDLGGDDTDNQEAYNAFAFDKTPQQTYNEIMGITQQNPFGTNVPGFIKGLSSIFGPLDYSNIFSEEEITALANQQFGLAMNPRNEPDKPGYNRNVPTVTKGVREGLTRGFGTLFGSPVGISTILGPVAAQRSRDPMGSAMMGAFSALAPTSLPGLVAQAIGRDTYTTKGALDYDPTRDPASSSFTGPSSLGGIVDALSIFGTGMTSTTAQEVYEAAKGAIEEAVKDFAIDPSGGLKDKDFNDMMSSRDDKSTGSMQISDMTQQGADMEDVNKGIGSLGSGMMMADASLFNPKSAAGALNLFAGPQIQDFFRDITKNPDATLQLGPRFDVDQQKMDDNIFTLNLPFATG